MSKMSESQHKSEMPDDSQMLDEYDFSQGIRGKYFQRFRNDQPESIQAYRTKVFSLCIQLSHAKEPTVRAATAKSLAVAAKTLAQLEAQAAQHITGD